VKLEVRSTFSPGTIEWDPHEIFDGQSLEALAESQLRGHTTERFGAIFLNHHCNLIGWMEVAIGGRTTVRIEPREIVRGALLTNAHYVIVAHNHPGEMGDPIPSEGDFLCTLSILKDLKDAGVELLEHLIVGETATLGLMSDQTHTKLGKRMAAQFIATEIALLAKSVGDFGMLESELEKHTDSIPTKLRALLERIR
jgi:hypothetical protein